jgi:hypothetical protein
VGAKARLPADVQARAVEEIRKAGTSEELKTIWASNGAEFSSLTPPQFGSFVSAEVKRWASVVKASGAKRMSGTVLLAVSGEMAHITCATIRASSTHNIPCRNVSCGSRV